MNGAARRTGRAARCGAIIVVLVKRRLTALLLPLLRAVERDALNVRGRLVAGVDAMCKEGALTRRLKQTHGFVLVWVASLSREWRRSDT